MSTITNISQSLQKVMLESSTKHEDKFIQRKRDVTGSNFCQTLVFGWLMEPECTSEGLAQIARTFGLDITAQGLDQRFTEQAAHFLHEVLKETVMHQITAKAPSAEGLLKRFEQIYIEDSSIVMLPGELAANWQGFGGRVNTSGSAVKLQLRWELQTGNLDGPHLFDAKVHDNKAVAAHRQKTTNCLTIDDRGYWKLDRFANEADQGQAWLSYMKSSTHLLVDDVHYTVDAYLRTCQTNTLDRAVMLGVQHQIPCRLIARRVCEEVARKRRRVIKRKAVKHGRTASNRALTLCDWVILVTNLPVELLSVEEAFTLIRVRWQIELLFKLWKSHGHIDKSRSENPWRQLCEFYAKLIGMVLQHWLLLASVWQFADRSLVKAAQTVKRHIMTIAVALTCRTTLEQELERLVFVLAKGCRINRSRNQPRSFQLLFELEGVGA